MSALGRTPSQTIGPYFGFALPWPDGPTVVPETTPGAIEIRGRLTDGRGDPVPDAMLEIWQADPDGHFDHPADPEGSSFRGFGRAPTDADGRFRFVTLKPGRVPDGAGAMQAPHIDVSIFARGLLTRLVTRLYFEDETAANDTDSTLALVGDPEARRTLLATREDGGYRFDIRLQGDGETVFFDI